MAYSTIDAGKIKPVLLKPEIFVWITISIAGLTLFGWFANIRLLSGQWGLYVPVALITALVFLFQGFTLLLCMRSPGQRLSRNFAITSVSITSVFCLIVLIEFIAGIKLGLEQLMSNSIVTINQIPVGRMSPLTAGSFLLINIATFILIIVQQAKQSATSVVMIALFVAAVNFIVLVGYAYGTPLLYGGKTVPTALPTALAFLAEGIGLFLMAVPYSLTLRSWNLHSFKGRLLRAFLLPVVIIVFLETWFESRIELHQPGNLLLFHALLALVFVAVIVIVIGFIARRIGDSLEQAEIIIKQQNDQLHELNANKDKFFSIIAHDLKSPFLGFLGLTQDLARNADKISVQELMRLGSAIHQSADNLFNLLHNLLEWAQMQSGSINLIQKNIPLSELIAKSTLTIKAASEQKSISINNLSTDSILVYADENMIDSVLLNLLSNAVKFTHRNGAITIETKKTDDQMVEISIGDTGVGMEKNLLVKLFKIGEKTGRKGTEGELSTGLGLMLCKEFIEKNGGTIRVESEEGIGSTFIFTLPCTS